VLLTPLATAPPRALPAVQPLRPATRPTSPCGRPA
jgi:hypothetical protein